MVKSDPTFCYHRHSSLHDGLLRLSRRYMAQDILTILFAAESWNFQRAPGTPYPSDFALKESTFALPFFAPASRFSAKPSRFFMRKTDFDSLPRLRRRHDATGQSLPSSSTSELKQASSATSASVFLLLHWQIVGSKTKVSTI
ncbi:hypothetical protein BBAD15_g11821 [Beauveria bassiana D1-5]|uniref:Uncharacterized protein n=1 Tax=Beauveria bassiana D1-5 TaxID=1245745 RepID=A0A0A2VA36_BEABA|nr:hypothetical protein BBAD15_g11821 [Beauveria bassiana D1-5]